MLRYNQGEFASYEPSGYYTYHQFSIEQFVWIWEQTAIISLYSIIWLLFYNQDGECLLRGTDWTFKFIQVTRSLRSQIAANIGEPIPSEW